ncbi:MAG: ribosome assembly RNA-binding protein YhbY [Erysipelothrix sp.]|jgi:RNA-binding protein|nr:ribosome assembly RNA-binding protein YhbY [Erysipelothrix sp.]
MVTQIQKKQLKAQAHHLKPVVMVGKEGVNDNVIVSTFEALEAHQLIKVHVSKNAPVTLLEIAYDLAGRTHATLIQIIGRMIVLYKPAKDRKRWII